MTTLPPNTSASGGIIYPNPQPPALNTNPPNLTFVQFLQSVLVGLSGFDGPFVRPDWQPEPPKRPDIGVNWIAFGIEGLEPDFDAYVGANANDDIYMQRNELMGLVVNFYGPAAYDTYGLVRDGFQMTQNLAALRQANVGFGYDTAAQHIPELINERWFDRWRATFYLRRQIIRSYPVLTFVSANGTIYANNPGGQTTELPVGVTSTTPVIGE